ncbi:MAG: class I SAM-dependent methyltransferase [Pyrinomonadaceae bacterium]|nr:class I SAM-dependent methyltransferase [Pyrinomonadaceae bacterium]
MSKEPLYDEIGVSYSATRSTDPKIAKQLNSELKGATRIVNIGAGTGSYEPQNVELVAVEPSSTMISQRTFGSPRVVQAFAENLPFEDSSFSHAMTVLSMHHWENRAQAFSEINRVATEKFVAVTWDPEADPFWLTRDYFPEFYEMDRVSFPSLKELKKSFDKVKMSSLEIPSDCKDGFLASFWKRPEAYLSRQVRESISSFSMIKDLSEGLLKLEDDLASGVWAKKNQAILSSSSLDVGYRLISAVTGSSQPKKNVDRS